MAYARAFAAPRRRPRRRGRRSAWLRAVRNGSRKAWLFLRRAQPWVQVAVGLAVLIALWATVNLAYHVIRKPTELFFPVSGALTKPPAETWHAYGALFRRYSTATISPELLAALAQVESAGDPVARTYWRWRFSWNPLALYQPASSAVGMYQMTDPTFAEARHYCIHDHRVVAEGAWHDLDACWFNGLYARVFPSDAVELTAASLDRKVASLIEPRHSAATPREKQELAALIHLCGAGAAADYVRRGFHLAPGARCGDHDASVYLGRVAAAKRQFQRLAQED